MNDATFWSLVDRLDWRHEGDDDRVIAPVVKALVKLPLREIESFEEILAQKLYAIDGREMGPGDRLGLVGRRSARIRRRLLVFAVCGRR